MTLFSDLGFRHLLPVVLAAGKNILREKCFFSKRSRLIDRLQLKPGPNWSGDPANCT